MHKFIFCMLFSSSTSQWKKIMGFLVAKYFDKFWSISTFLCSFLSSKIPKASVLIRNTMLFLQISIMLVCPKYVHLLLLICCSAEKLPCCGLTCRLLLHVDTIAWPTCYWPRKLSQGARVQRYWKEKWSETATAPVLNFLFSHAITEWKIEWKCLAIDLS